MQNIDVELESEKLYKELLKIEIAQAKKKEKDINEFTGSAINKCLKYKGR